MDQRDREAIETLFDKLAEAESRAGPRDREAEALILDLIRRHPAAPYYMAQTIVVQQDALENAQRRIEELESGSGGGFLAGLFGGADRNQRPAARAPQQQQQAPGPWADRRGGSFLGGAAQTAVGVAGGVLLGGLVSNALFGGGSASAAEVPAPEAPEEVDAGGDAGGDAGDFDGGFDF